MTLGLDLSGDSNGLQEEKMVLNRFDLKTLSIYVNTKKWYRRKAELWSELGDEYHSAGKISSKESVKDACGRQCAIVRQKDCLRF
jgi:hypothetical protein